MVPHIVLMIVAAGSPSSQEAAEVLWSQDFERPPHRVEAWASDGRSAVNAIEITEEQAHSGKCSLKVDVTLQSGSYHYWYIPTRHLPAVDGMVASGWVYVRYCPEGARPGLGFNVLFDPLPGSGCRLLDGPSAPPAGQWFKMSLDLGAPARKMARDILGLDRAPATLDRIGMMFQGGRGQRVVIYIDDLEVRGRIPPDFDKADAAAVQAGQEVFRRYLEGEIKRFTDLQAALAAPLSVPSASQGAQAHARKVNQWREGLLYAAKQELLRLQRQTFVAPADRAPWEEAATRAERLAALVKSLTDYKAKGWQPFVTYVWSAIDDRRIVPMAFPLEALVSDTLEIAAAPGEYEPATFAIYPHQNLSRLTVTPTDLKGPAGTIPAAAVNVRWVKCWYQAGVEVWDVKHATLTPELLLHDDNLLVVDHVKQKQWLKAPSAPRDADTLQPIDLANEFLKQVWVTVHVPEGIPAGVYEGALTFRRDRERLGQMTLRVTVHPFALPPPCLDYALYYRGRLAKQGTLGSELKSPEQYEAEMRDLVAHGVTMPTCYTSLLEPVLDETIALRRKCGVRVDPLLSLGLTTGAPTAEVGLEVLRLNVAEALARVSKLDIKTLYVYGVDEASGEQLRNERAAFERVHKAGAKVFVACYRDAFGIVGDLLDLAVFAGKPDPQVAREWHSKGAKVYSYANPQCGVEAPGRYRRNFGLALWKAGFDGACDYAYQHAFGNIWDDFDDPRYRDHVMAYPTVNGVVGTVQWEGFREAVDDVRYLTALLGAIKEAAAAGGERGGKAAEAKAFLDALDVETCDLHATRARMADWIIALRR